jgi:hypothetical protein
MPRQKLTQYEFAATAIAKTINQLRKWERGRDAIADHVIRQALVETLVAACIITDDPATVDEAISHIRMISTEYRKEHEVRFKLPPEFQQPPEDNEFRNQADGIFEG